MTQSHLHTLETALDAIPSTLMSRLTVGELRALVRMAIAQDNGNTAYRHAYDAGRLHGLSNGGARLVEVISGPDRQLEGFAFNANGRALISGLRVMS